MVAVVGFVMVAFILRGFFTDVDMLLWGYLIVAITTLQLAQSLSLSYAQLTSDLAVNLGAVLFVWTMTAPARGLFKKFLQRL